MMSSEQSPHGRIMTSEGEKMWVERQQQDVLYRKMKQFQQKQLQKQQEQKEQDALFKPKINTTGTAKKLYNRVRERSNSRSVYERLHSNYMKSEDGQSANETSQMGHERTQGQKQFDQTWQ